MQQPDTREDQADETDGAVHSPAGDQHQLDGEVDPDRPRPALQTGQQNQDDGQADQVGAGDRRQPAVRDRRRPAGRAARRWLPGSGCPPSRRGSSSRDRAAARQRMSVVVRSLRVPSEQGARRPRGDDRPGDHHAAAGEALAVMAPDSSTSAVAVSMASGSVAAAITRSGPNRSSARSARPSTSSARGEPLLVTTT